MQIITRLFRFDLAHKQVAEVIEKETVHLGLQFTHHSSPSKSQQQRGGSIFSSLSLSRCFTLEAQNARVEIP